MTLAILFQAVASLILVSIDGLPIEELWIRADYIRIYDFLENRETPPVYNNLTPAAVVTG